MEISSNIYKLARHIDRIRDIPTNPKPINIMVDVTSRCNLKCPFCYVGNRKRTYDLNYKDLTNFLSIVKPLSVDISGGEPTIWKPINKFIDWLFDNDIKIGLITNGKTLQKVKTENLNKLDWLRISINDYIDNGNILNLPEIAEDVYIGAQYIYHPGSPLKPDLKFLISKFIDDYPKFDYVRVSEDVTSKVSIDNDDLDYMCYIFKRIRAEVYNGECYIGWIKPLIEADGNVYACAGNINPDKKDKDPNDPSFIGTIKEPEKFLEYKPRNVLCHWCKCEDRNKFIELLLKKDKILHEEFI